MLEYARPKTLPLRLITPRTRFYVHTPSRPFAFPTPPSLSPSAKTTFGPFPSPHTLADLHALAYTNRVAIPIEPCLQCQLKNLPCPTTTNSPAHAGFGPAVTAGGATLPRPRTTHPRFPACLRCIRAGEADACIAQRRATPAERAAIADAGSSQAQQLQLELGTVLLPTDRDVLSPELWERKMVRREELLAAAAKREAKAGLAPKRVEGWRSGREEVRKGQEKDRVLLSGRGREAVLLPHERWGCRWVGKREREEWEFVEMAVRKIEADEEAMKSGGVGLGVDI
ncbi:tubulin polyglutamylase ttll6-like isoform x1 [Neofusicoccum parvum]|nr:tubulin polyglutamylase ttll6-like isoform x1 [Neofusicoccum parvum]